MFKHNKLHSAMLLIAVTSAGQSREIYYQEDFSDGVIPIDWSTTDLSGQNALWTYCADPNTGQANGCPPFWDDGLNAQGPFAATTANNGFMTMDSDIYGNLPNNHISILSFGPFNFSSNSSVHVEFEGFIGAYTVAPPGNEGFEVSNDNGSNWTTFDPYPNMSTGAPAPPNVRWSFNPTKHVFDVSSVAANQSDVIMRFSWTGNFEFLWSIDDLVIADSPDIIFDDGFNIQPPP